jgi:sulfur relay protein TusB/DsrH
MATLHLVINAGSEPLETCIDWAGDSDQVVLLDAGVDSLSNLHCTALMDPLILEGRIAALEADVRARGLAGLCQSLGMAMVSDTAWVGLLAECEQVMSWR